MIGGRRPLQGRKPADRRVRVERPHAPYFRYTGPGQLVAKAAAHDPQDRPRPGVGAVPRHRDRAAAGERGGGRRAAVQEEGARDLQLGRDQLVRLRDRGDPAGARPGRRRRRARVLARGGDRDRRSCSRSWRCPIARSAAPTRRRRRLRRVARRTSAPLARPRRGGGAPDRLRDDRRGVDRVGRSPRSTRSCPASTTSGSRSPSSSIALITVANLRGLRESGNIFAIPTYLVRRPGPADGRHRGGRHRDRRRPAVMTPSRSTPSRPGPRAVGSSSCSRRSPAARWR